MSYKTSNPALSGKTFSRFDASNASGPSMTLAGTVNKTYILLAVLLGAAFASWSFGLAPQFLLGGALVAAIVGVVYIFKPHLVFLSLIYAALEGAVLGGLSTLIEKVYPGIVLNTVVMTVLLLVVMLVSYHSGLIKVTEKLKSGIITAMCALCLVYIVDLLLMVFGHRVPFLHEGGWMGILVSLFITGLASFNLLLNFDFIEQGVKHRAPQFYEWYAAYGLILALVWLYLEVLNLLEELRS